MKLWITGSIAVVWVAVFSAWVISQDGTQTTRDESPGASRPAQATPGGKASLPPPPPRGRADWVPRDRGPRGPEGHGRMRHGTFGLGAVLLFTLDKNKDAALSETEIEGAREALLSLDENQDGEVSQEEFFKAMPRVMKEMGGQQMDRGGPGGFNRGDRSQGRDPREGDGRRAPRERPPLEEQPSQGA